MDLKYLVIEQKVVDDVFQTLVTPKDTEFEATNFWHYTMWYNGQSEACTEYTVTVQGPFGELYANEHVKKPGPEPEPQPEPEPEPEEELPIPEGE